MDNNSLEAHLELADCLFDLLSNKRRLWLLYRKEDPAMVQDASVMIEKAARCARIVYKAYN